MGDIQEYLEGLIGRSVNPFDYASPLTEKEALEEYEFWFNDQGFSESEKLIYHKSPSEEEELTRFRLLETTTFDFYSKGRNPEIHLSEDIEDLVEESEILHEGAVDYINPENTEDEVVQSFEFSGADKTIHITSDYHSEGVDGIRSSFDGADYLVLSADTSEIDPDPENYAEILGPAAPLASKIFGWRTLAETKEIGREILEKYRGPRF